MLSVQKSAEVIVAEYFFSVKDRINRSLQYNWERRNGQMGTENRESCSQRDSAERKGYVRAHRSFNRIWKERGSAEPDILGKILDKDNLNRAYMLSVKLNAAACVRLFAAMSVLSGEGPAHSLQPFCQVI